nr:hypothetical protein Iba_chr05fCG12090 [Ipomoea batatas]
MGRMVGKFAGLVLALLLIHEVMVLQLHFAMAARELPSSAMPPVGDRLVKIQPDRKKKLAPPAPKANSPQHYKPPRRGRERRVARSTSSPEKRNDVAARYWSPSVCSSRGRDRTSRRAINPEATAVVFSIQ